MRQSNKTAVKAKSKAKSIQFASDTFPADQLNELIALPGVHVTGGHYQFPETDGNRVGNHMDALFILEPITENDEYVSWIVDDIELWIEDNNIGFEVVFAPAQPSAVRIVQELVKRRKKKAAFWQYLPTGWFGEKLVEGSINNGDRVLVFNSVAQHGRCVGERLPAFAEQLGGKPVAAAVFAKGTGNGVVAAEERWGEKLYAALQIPIEVSLPDSCTKCKEGNATAVPWTHFKEAGSEA
ncbi:MAG: hypothetical protein IT342_20965 [Candidatus Melainabacteria bacterium]|nr:hypothetical protein [Candidatus Melainabacteria bacterium]